MKDMSLTWNQTDMTEKPDVALSVAYAQHRVTQGISEEVLWKLNLGMPWTWNRFLYPLKHEKLTYEYLLVVPFIVVTGTSSYTWNHLLGSGNTW